MDCMKFHLEKSPVIFFYDQYDFVIAHVLAANRLKPENFIGPSTYNSPKPERASFRRPSTQAKITK